MTGPRHGTRAMIAAGCTCEGCRLSSPVLGPTKPSRRVTHGTANRYRNYGCRCEPCRRAGSIEGRQRREARAARDGRYIQSPRQSPRQSPPAPHPEPPEPELPPLVFEPTWTLPRGWLTAQDGAA